MPPPRISFHPPLLNSACPWATTSEDLRALLHSPSTGAITVRTSVLPTKGFNHQPAQHRYVFFDVGSGRVHSRGSADGPVPAEFWAGTTTTDDLATASLNSLGYSPFPLSTYLDILASLSCEMPHVKKTVIVSVTGSPDEVRGCYDMIVRRRREGAIHFPLAVEINLSCPNITNAPPPAYDMRRLEEYLAALPSDTDEDVGSGSIIPVGSQNAALHVRGPVPGARPRTADRRRGGQSELRDGDQHTRVVPRARRRQRCCTAAAGPTRVRRGRHGWPAAAPTGARQRGRAAAGSRRRRDDGTH
ncbi:hypothetical protein NLG97_g1660 [Lecanicillium saksenae]|uniref:Uncharacterized protein n=1 Tax=Lecanicillium saksenae TaxID=468837 RepID=A0ACC1R3R9_9HYPO|nr:hypothetical protein NLG97_g1660 [Lecanicillium saksenae]